MFSPVGNGWILNEQNGNLSYGIKWFDGDMVPVSLEEILEPDHHEVSESEQLTFQRLHVPLGQMAK